MSWITTEWSWAKLSRVVTGSENGHGIAEIEGTGIIVERHEIRKLFGLANVVTVRVWHRDNPFVGMVFNGRERVRYRQTATGMDFAGGQPYGSREDRDQLSLTFVDYITSL